MQRAGAAVPVGTGTGLPKPQAGSRCGSRCRRESRSLKREGCQPSLAFSPIFFPGVKLFLVPAESCWLGDSGGEQAGCFPVPAWQLGPACRGHQPSHGREGAGDVTRCGPAALGCSGSSSAAERDTWLRELGRFSFISHLKKSHVSWSQPSSLDVIAPGRERTLEVVGDTDFYTQTSLTSVENFRRLP